MPENTKRYELKIHRLTKEDIRKKLAHFESKYRMSSREFIERYNRCDLEEDLDYMRWAGYYDMAAEVGLVSLELED